MGVQERSCLASRNIGDRGCHFEKYGGYKVGDIIVCIGFKGVKESLHSFNPSWTLYYHFTTTSNKSRQCKAYS
jgi:hypothetical protein